MNTSEPTQITPRGFVVGSLASAAPHHDLVYHAAAEACDTEHVHMVWTQARDRLWYIAAPSSSFSTSPTPVAPLAAALPGHPEHQGDGAYTATIGAEVAVVIVRNTDDPTQAEILSFIGEPEQVASFIHAHTPAGTLPLVTDTFAGAPWQGYRIADERRLGSLAYLTGKTGWMASGLTVIPVAILLAVFGFTSISADQTETQRSSATTTLIDRIKTATTNPLRATTTEIRAVAAGVSEAQGHVLLYRVRNGQPGLVLDLPSWATATQIRNIPGLQRVENDPNTGRLIAYRGDTR
jgi:hypothetical protein